MFILCTYLTNPSFWELRTQSKLAMSFMARNRSVLTTNTSVWLEGMPWFSWEDWSLFALSQVLKTSLCSVRLVPTPGLFTMLTTTFGLKAKSTSSCPSFPAFTESSSQWNPPTSRLTGPKTLKFVSVIWWVLLRSRLSTKQFMRIICRSETTLSST